MRGQRRYFIAVAVLVIVFCVVGSARKWSAVVTACVAALAAVVLFGFRASGDGLYMLPIMGSAVVALCASIAFTLDIRARSRHLDR